MDSSGLSILNKTAERLSGPGLLHQLVRRTGQQLQQPALDYMGNNHRYSFTYRELHDAADVLAARITRAVGGVEGQLVVPVLLHQSPILYISLLAILKAGGAFCPLNIDAPPERVKFILKDVSATVLLVSRDLVAEVPKDISSKIIVVDEDGDDDSPSNQGSLEHRVATPEDLAYVMYTSGSTGTPKGVGISHDAATQALLGHDRHIPQFSRFLQFAAPTFDVSVFEIFFPLFRGSTLVTVRRVEMLNDLPAVLRNMEVDACELTPTVAGSLLRNRESAPKLRLLLTIGEMLNAPVVEEFGGSKGKPSMLWAMYGPTEATIHWSVGFLKYPQTKLTAQYSTLQTAFSSDSSTGNIGVPLDTVSCFIIKPADSADENAAFEVLPAGEVGELAVGGYQLASGYINRPEQTRAVFIQSPYGRVYRTGDKARLLPDGRLECLGRLSDGQVKLRGQRLELGEVEQAVLRTSGCHSAVAAVVNSILVVFCAVDAGVAEGTILDKCRDWLPQFMVPGEILLMADFPRLPSGKVDRKKLKSDHEQRKADWVGDTDEVLPVDEIEGKVLSVVTEVLNCKVSVTTLLAAAGLDSLKAIKLASALRDSGLDMSSMGLLNLKRVSEIVFEVRRQLVQQTPSSPSSQISLKEHLEEIILQNSSLQGQEEFIEDVTPCTPLQSAMLAETVQNDSAYCNEIQLQAPKEHTAQQVLAALRELARRNEVLRAGFATWRGKFISILFTDPRDGQLEVSNKPMEALSLSKSEDYLRPLRIQIQEGTTTSGPRILIHIHHSIYDGWSMDILLSDLSRLLAKGPLTSRPSFRNITRFYSEQTSQDSDDAARVFWTEHLRGWSKVPLPKLVDRATRSRQIRSSRTRLQILKQIVDKEISDIGCSAHVLFQASLAIVWSGITGARDVVIGSVTSGRTIPVAGIEKIIGPCIASLPLRVDFGSLTASLDLLNNLHANNRKIMEHCALPLSEIKRLASLQPGESFYDVLFAYQESLDSHARASNLVKETRHLDRLETPLLVEVEPTADGFYVQMTYHSDVFSPEVIQQMVQQFESTALAMLANTSQDIGSIRKSINTSLSVYNASPPLLESGSDLAKGFEEIARNYPDENALCFAESLGPASQTVKMSFGELNNVGNQVAWYLRAQEPQVGEVVAIIMDKLPTLYASVLGIVKAGCAYLPILPSTPLARVRDILEQAGIQHCLVDTAYLPRSSNILGCRVIDIDLAALGEFPTNNLDIPTDSSRLAYIIYTSGTTGVPKGVAVTQHNIMANISHLKSIYPTSTGRQSRLLQTCSQAFDVSVFEIFFTWHNGMCLCAGTNDTIFEDLEYAIRELDVTHLSMTPTVASLINPGNVPGVDFLVTAGEPLTRGVLDTWGDRLWQGYGPSETTNICSVKRMAVGDHIEHLGHAFPNTSTFILFPSSLDTVPLGWVGELCFGGDQVAQGYFNMPKLTSQKFIQHPQYGRLYRSGDLGRMLPDGSLVILGRLDDQIKLRGQRIEISEINSVATSTEVVKSAVTLLIKREKDLPEQLALFYASQKERVDFHELVVDAEVHRSLLATLQSRLPGYMVPSYLIPVSLIPLLPSGKVDRRRLQSCFKGLGNKYLEATSKALQDIGDQGDWTATEGILADIIAESTKTQRHEFGRWTPLAMLGVDSVSAIELARKISSQLNIRLAVSAVLQNPTIVQLARHISEKMPILEEALAAPVQFFSESYTAMVIENFAMDSKLVTEVLPCTPLQEAMLSHNQRSYYNKVLLRLHAEPEDMKSYWSTLSQRHQILRTCFVTTSDTQRAIAQVVIEGWEIPWLTFDVIEPSFDRAIQEHLRTLPDPIDTGIPPVSLGLLRYRGSTFLSFICHHALYDGVAMESLLKEVEALARGEGLQPPVAYRQFLQSAMSLPGDVEQFWAEQFRSYCSSALFSQASPGEMDQCTHTTSLGLPLTELQAQIRTLGVSLLSICQASWANVLAMVHKRSDVCFGNVVNGRTLNIEGLDRLVAPCFNTIPVRADFARNSSNIDLVKQMQTLNAATIPYQFTPLRLVQKTASQNGRHLFDTLLLLQKPLQDMDKDLWTLEEDSGEMDIPLVCEIVPCPGLNSLIINIHRDMSIVTGETATILAETFKFLLQTTLSAPHATLADRASLPATFSLGLDALEPRQERFEALSSHEVDEGDWTEGETQVRQVLAELAGASISQIRRHTTIFQLGLDSINAVQVAYLLRQKGFSVSASDVIECPSCSKIAAKLVENSLKKTTEVKAFDFESFAKEVSPQINSKLPHNASVEAVLPCTPVQSAMLASFLQSGGDHYVNAVSYLVDEGIKMDDLEAAWKSLQSRHPMLRTGFVPVNHTVTSFAMVRYNPKWTVLPMETFQLHEDEELDLLRRKMAMGITVQNLLSVPPWKVMLVEKGSRFTMNIIIHHALYDAASLQHMLGDLSGYMGGIVSLPLPKVEVALSSILSKAHHGYDAEREFWEAKASHTVVNKFPVMTPLRVGKRTILAETMIASLPFSKLQEATQASNTSIQAVIQAAWTRVLASYLGESSVIFGIVLSGRTSEETKDAPFPCLNTVPIVASNVSSNIDLANYMMEYNQHIHKHQFAPLGQVQKWLGHPTGLIFDTLLAYQKMEQNKTDSEPWKLVEDEAMVEYPVSLEIEPMENDEIRLCITYYDDILPQEQAKLLAKQFDASLKDIACNPSGCEDDLHVKTPNLYSILPAASATLPAPVQLLHQFVEERTLLHPNKTALEFVTGWHGEFPIKQAWSYGELDRLGNKVASILKETAPPGSIVAVHFDKCPEAYFSILGILKAGCAFVALDPTAPKARKEFILQDSKAPCLLTKDPSSLDFDVGGVIVSIEMTSLQRVPDMSEVYRPNIAPSDTCYCLYTSGTTGTPKGCEITHDNAVQAMMAFQELFKGHWDETSRWLQFAALHFDVSVLEQYWSWSVGIAVVAAPKDLILDDLTGSISRLDITHIDLTPSLARLTHPDEVPSLCRGVFITGGEQLKQEILDIWGPKAVIHNAYGPTEATIGVTMYQRVPINGRPSNIGQQFPNVGSYVFRQGTEIPVVRGGVGELCVSGKLVGKGYLHRPELTEERFPVLAEFGERIYRTGDLVRMLHDGCFDFLGRADDQVKLRGQRLEIAEIDHTIRTDVDEIRDTATIVTHHGTSGKDVLVSFIVGQETYAGELRILPDSEGLSAKAKEACRARLPGYMVPTYIFSLPFIPLSPNNKAEVKDLKRLFSELSHEMLVELNAAAAAPVSRLANENMKKLVRILADFSNSKAEDLSPLTSIFDVGVDSITALRLSSLLKDRGFPSASPAILLKYPVVADLANALTKKISKRQDKLIREARQAVQAHSHKYRALVCRDLGVKPRDIEYIAPCSPLQQGIISRTMTSDRLDAYFNTFELELRYDTSLERLRAAWEGLVKSEAILRTAFVPTTDGFIQVAFKSSQSLWEEKCFDSEELARRFLEERNADWIKNNASAIAKPFLLTHTTTPRSRRLVMSIFHALYDGNSLKLMLDRVLSIYRHEKEPSSPSFLEALMHGPLWRYDDCRPFWEEHLHGSRFKPMPQLTSKPQKEGVMVTRSISATALETVRSLQNVTLQAVVLALWTSALQSYLARQVNVGVIVSGRAIELPDIEQTIGPLFNTVPFYPKTVQKQTWESLIRRCHDFNTALLDFQHVPLKNIQKWCSAGKPLFDILFALQIEAAQPESVLPWEVVDSHASPDYPLALEAVYTRNGQLRLTLAAEGHIATSLELEELLDQIESCASSMAAAPDSEVAIVYAEDLLDDQDSIQIAPLSSDQVNSFEWTELAITIQREVALLADVPLESVTERVTVLELGLDSIDIIKLSAKLKKMGVAIAPSQIMRCQSIARMVLELDKADNVAPIDDLPNDALQNVKHKLWKHMEQRGLDMDGVESILPPTPLQESMVAAMIQSSFESYFNHDILEIAETVNLLKLQTAWAEVIGRSPILRTSFYEVEDQELDMAYCQVISKAQELDFSHTKLDDLAGFHDITSKSKRLARDGAGTMKLFQLSFATFGSRRFVIISMAHALYDGWSLSLLYQDLQPAYDGSSTSRPSSEVFLSKISEAEGLDAKEFWTQYLQGVTPTIVPMNESSAADSEVELQKGELTSTISLSDITGFCKQHSISQQALCQASWAIMLAQQMQTLDVTFGVVVSGRDFDGAEDLMFPTMNTVASRCILHGSPAEFLRYLEDNMGDVREFQNYSLRKAQLAANLQGQGLFNTLFILQKSPSSPASDPMLLSIEGSSSTEYPVCVEAEALGDGLVWRVAYDPRCTLGEGPQKLLADLDGIMKFLMTSDASDILLFEERGVSICGMSSVMIKDDWTSDEASVEEDVPAEIEEWDSTSSAIREVLHQISNVPITSIRRSDTLYHLGLDSISAIKVSSLLRRQMINLRPQDLIKATSIGHMADMAILPRETDVRVIVDSDTWTPPEDIKIDQLLDGSGLSLEEIELLPALPMQVYMLSAWQNAEGAVFYPEFAYSIASSFELETIQTAWDGLVSEVPLLRTRFIATRSREVPFLQAIANDRHLRLGQISQDFNAAGISQVLAGVQITRQEDKTWMFRLRIHHALYDGFSLPALMQRFSALLNAETVISDQGLSYWKKFAVAQASPARRDSRREFWSKYLQGCPQKPAKKPPVAEVKERVSYLKKSAVPEMTRIRKFAAQNGIGVQSLFLAAYAKVLAAETQDDAYGTVVFGIYLANRAEDHDLPSMYPTLALVPLRVEAARNRSLSSIAAVVQQDIHAISSDGRADVGLQEISAWTGVKLTSFVNFLSLPTTSEASIGPVRLIPTDLAGPLTTEETAENLHDTWLQRNVVKSDIPLSVDIEASVHDSGLDIGVFASRQQISSSDAAALVSDIVAHLDEI
ncbi:hypothetical protein G7046_g2447 [Stylonectria norvegica]|nr:hypothetical protein G7046_g2447 [Stylonectria norvegica]